MILPAFMTPKPKHYIHVLLLWCVVCYVNSLWGDFVFDDTVAIVQNRDVTSGATLREFLNHDFWGTPMADDISHKSYRPLTALSFRLNVILAGGLHPLGFHIVNVGLHALCTASFWILCSRHAFPTKPRTALLSGLIFATHPIHTESVASIVGRAELLSCLFFLLALLVYLPAIKGEAHCDGAVVGGSNQWSSVAVSAATVALAFLAMISKACRP